MQRVLSVLIGTLTVIATTHAAGPVPAGTPTFAKDVAPIIFNNCTTCHRTGEVAPMTFLSYEDVRPWAKVIKTKVGLLELARQLGVRLSTFSSWERGITCPSVPIIFRLAKLLNTLAEGLYPDFYLVRGEKDVTAQTG